MIRRSDKRGADTNVIIWFFLALIILGLVVYGFMAPNNFIKKWFVSLTGGEETIGIVSQGCQSACIANSKYDFCNRERDLNYKDSTGKIRTIKGSCYDFATQETTFGIEDCSSVTCDYKIVAQEGCKAPNKYKNIQDPNVIGTYSYVTCTA